MHDLIYCFRMLRKRPSFTIVAVLTLGLAIGASTALSASSTPWCLIRFLTEMPHNCISFGKACRSSACRISFEIPVRSLSI